MIKSNINSIRLPELKNENQEIIKELYQDLPNGWKINEKNEILNELGLVMVNIEEEEKEENKENENENEIEKNEFGTEEIKLNRLTKSIEEILNELEIEEIEEEKLNQSKKEIEEEEEDQTSFSELEEIVNENFKEEKEEEIQFFLKRLEKEKEELKEWGINGLEGLKNKFKSNLTSQKFKSDLKPNEIQNPISSSFKSSKTKKSVSFAIDSNISKDTTITNSSLPTGGIMLPDIIEHPIEISSSNLIKSKGNSINGKNAHLNPRLASLLPKSYLQSQQNPTDDCEPSSSRSVQPNTNEVEGSSSEYEEEDEIDDSEEEGLYELSDEEEDDDEWPNDIDLQTALDMREAALEYHSKRQSLGIGIGTGSLGGEGIPIDENEEEEWVPIDHRPKANGIPRQIPTSSRFKSGRLSKWKSNLLSSNNPNLEKENTLIKEGKLLGIEPILNGPLPMNGSRIYELPSRTEKSTEIDEDLTKEEIELMNSRLNILSMDEESRMNAERTGNELIEWMEKVKKGEVLIQEDEQIHQSNLKPIKQSMMNDEVKVLNEVKESNWVNDLNDEICSRSDKPPNDQLEEEKVNQVNEFKSKEIRINSIAKKVSRFKYKDQNQ